MSSTEEQEGGVMDFRNSPILVTNKRGINVRTKQRFNIFSVRLSFSHCRTYAEYGYIDDVKWCQQFDPSVIMKWYLTFLFDDCIPDSAKWENGNTLYFEIDNSKGTLTGEFIHDELKYDSLEDGPFEGGPGSFWVIPISEF